MFPIDAGCGLKAIASPRHTQPLGGAPCSQCAGAEAVPLQLEGRVSSRCSVVGVGMAEAGAPGNSGNGARAAGSE